MTDLYRYRRIHVIVLGVILLGVIALVIVRGYTTRGGMLIGVCAILFGLRLWQFKRMRGSGNGGTGNG